MKPFLLSAALIVVGVLVGWTANEWFMNDEQGVSESTSSKKAPLYWVAPMDSSYRRDQPGKSPMGMDLVPVYEEDKSGHDHGPGTVSVSPTVVNNLGVRTESVTQGRLRTQISTVGYVKYDEDTLIHLHPRVEGWIETLYVKAAGDPVQQGQPVYTLYSPELVNAQEELLIARKRNNAALINAAIARLKALQLSDAFIEQLITTGKPSQSVTFYAPQSGVVDGLSIREGFYVKPGTTLMSIAKLDTVWVEAEVFERDLAFIKKGMPVSMTLDAKPGQQWQGQVDYIYPKLDPNTRTLRLRLRFDNAHRQLKPNMFVNVTLHAEADEEHILVPRSAVIRTGEQERVVLALGEGQFKSIAVTLGKAGNDLIEVIDGLHKDDEVVTAAQFLIDSESSIESDFQRMSLQEKVSAVWVEGESKSVNTEQRVATLTHGVVEEWGWPAMTMEFNVSEAVDIHALAAARDLHYEITKQDDGAAVVTAIHVMSRISDRRSDRRSDVPSATTHGLINEIDDQSRRLNISREAIAKWGRPAATMDFIAADNIDLSGLSEGQNITFTFEVRDDFVIVAIEAAKQSHAHQNRSGGDHD